MSEQHYAIERGCWAENAGRVQDQVVHEMGQKLLAEAKGGQPYTFRYDVSVRRDEYGAGMAPRMMVRADLFFQPVEVMTLRAWAPQPVSEMDWPGLTRTAVREIGRRLKRKLLFWRRWRM
jgi:hypothetical protein